MREWHKQTLLRPEEGRGVERIPPQREVHDREHVHDGLTEYVKARLWTTKTNTSLYASTRTGFRMILYRVLEIGSDFVDAEECFKE